jgi:hypothetical protein
MPANVDAMVRAGIQAYRGGKKAEARTLLEKAVELDQYNEQAWMWLSAVVDSPEEQRTCLENVLFINPNNENARNGLKILAPKPDAGAPQPSPTSAPAPQPAPADDPFANASFTAPPSAPAVSSPPIKQSSGPFSGSALGSTPSSVEWEQPPTATSSPSSTFRPPETSSREYDDWVSGLNLKSDSTSSDESSTSAGSSPFADPSEIFGKDFFDDEEEDAAPVPPASPDPFMAGPFTAEAFDLSDATPAPPVPQPSTGPLMSPGRDTSTGKISLAPDDFTTSGGDLFGPDDDFDVSLDEPDPAEYFQRIPPEIKPNRLPGTKERLSPVMIVGVVVLVVLNLGVLVMLMTKLLA